MNSLCPAQAIGTIFAPTSFFTDLPLLYLIKIQALHTERCGLMLSPESSNGP